jgi:hypothetical protein
MTYEQYGRCRDLLQTNDFMFKEDIELDSCESGDMGIGLFVQVGILEFSELGIG